MAERVGRGNERPAADRDEQIERDAPRPASHRPDDGEHGGDREQLEQQVGHDQMGWAAAEIAGGPDAEDLQAAERMKQVAERPVTGVAGGADTHELPGGRQRRNREHQAADERERERHPGAPDAVERDDENDDHRESCKPDKAENVEAGEHGRGGDRQRDLRADAKRSRQRRRGERGNENDERRDGELLDAAPQRVAVQERGLRADERDKRTKEAASEKRRDERVHRQRDHRGHEGDVRLEEPGCVLACQFVPDAERQHRSDRIPGPEVDAQERRVGGRREPGQAAAVRHRVVDEGKPGRRVVERDVAGEGRAPRQHDRRRVHTEDRERSGCRPHVRTSAVSKRQSRRRRRRARRRAAP